MIKESVELYLYSPYGPYGLYRASVPVQGFTALNESTVMNNEWEGMWKDVVIGYLTQRAPLISSGYHM